MDKLVPRVKPAAVARLSSDDIIQLKNATSSGYYFPDRVAEGGRNDAIPKYVGHLRGSGVRENLIIELANTFNKAHCTPPLADAEVNDIASRYAPQSLDIADWPDPQEIKAALPAVPVFDLDMLPDVFKPFVKDCAERMGQPPTSLPFL